MGKVLEYNATLVDRIDVTDKLSIFKVRSDEEVPGFLPGQYVTLGMNNEVETEKGSVRRPMSVVSAPEEDGFLEFYIRYVDWPESDNPLTHLLWPTKVGARLWMKPKAVGHFTVHHTLGDDDKRLRVCVAAGTGLAPFISMARSCRLRGADHELKEYAILHGASYPKDLGYGEELADLKARGLAYFPTISRPKEAADWTGDTGRVEDFFLPERIGETEERLGLGPGGLNAEEATILICGLQGTIGQTISRLVSRGFVPDNRKLRRSLGVPDDVVPSLFFEQYDSTPALEVDNEEVMGPLRAKMRAALRLE